MSVDQDSLNKIPKYIRDGKRTAEYSGWVGIDVQPPVLLASKDPCAAKDEWRRSFVDTNTSIPKEIWQAFTASKELGIWPRESIRGAAKGGDNPEYWAGKVFYSVYDLLPYAAYESREGNRLYAVGIRESPDGDNPHIDLGNSPTVNVYWFSWLKGQNPRFVGDMLLLDYADLDCDGKTELLFWRTDENEDGYVLLWDNLSKTAVSTWHYH